MDICIVPQRTAICTPRDSHPSPHGHKVRARTGVHDMKQRCHWLHD